MAVTPWPIYQYDGQAIEDYYSRRPLAVAERLSGIAPLAVGWYAASRFTNFTRKFLPKDVGAAMNAHRAEELRELLVTSGSVTFIKSGQAMSLRGDLLKNSDYVRELEKLQDEVGVFDNDVAFRIIEEDLGRPADEIYEFEQRTPIASASIGQVYKARIRATGELVALKVQRPDAFESAAVDMFILRRFASWFKQWKKLRSDMVAIADEFGQQLFGELDYVQEARNCLRFKELYGNIPGIFVPGVHMGLTTRRVLTQEWVEGDKGPWPLDGERMLTVGLQCSTLQILEAGFFHADPHRGNLLRTPKGELAYLDFGMMAEVPAEKRFALIGTTLGLQNRDIGLIAGNLVTLGFLPEDTDLPVLVPALEAAVMKASDGGGASKLNFTRLNAEITNLSEMLSFRIPPFYSLIVRTLTILEGLAFTVDPEFRLVKGAYPYIAKQILNSPSPELKALMSSVLITPTGGIQWQRLEQLVSIAQAAKIARTKQDFEDLKRAQDRSDLRKKINGQTPEDAKVTLDLTLAVLDFLLSERGRFLRDPLITELLDTLEALQAAGVNLASVATGGLLAPSLVAPDRVRLEALGNIIVQISRSRTTPATTVTPTGGVAVVSRRRQDLPRLREVAESALSIVRDRERQQQFEPVLRRLGDFSREVAAALVERSARRAVKSGISLLNSPQTFPRLGRFLDTLAPLANSGRSDPGPVRRSPPATPGAAETTPPGVPPQPTQTRPPPDRQRLGRFG